MTSEIYWYGSEEDGFNAEVGGCRVASIRFAKEGEAEGGLGVLARFMAGAFMPGEPQPPLSPAGWYWQATATRGVWTTPERADTPEEAKAAAEAALAGYLAKDGA